MIQEHRMTEQPAENYLLGKVGRSKSYVVTAASWQPPEINATNKLAKPISVVPAHVVPGTVDTLP